MISADWKSELLFGILLYGVFIILSVLVDVVRLFMLTALLSLYA